MDLTPSLPTTVLTSVGGTYVVYWLRHSRRVDGLRAASFASVVFVAVARASASPTMIALCPVFFGSTYCAMSEPHRLSERSVALAGLLFGLLYSGLHALDLPYLHQGIGGTLGGIAFVACLIVYGFDAVIRRDRRSLRASRQ